jgi:hypothetical protein
MLDALLFPRPKCWKRLCGTTVSDAPISHQVHLYNPGSTSVKCYCVIRSSGTYLLSFASHADFPSSRANFSSVFCHLDRLAVVSRSLANCNNVYNARNRLLVILGLRIAGSTSDDYYDWKRRRLAYLTEEVNEGRLRNTASTSSRGTDIVVAAICLSLPLQTTCHHCPSSSCRNYWLNQPCLRN